MRGWGTRFRRISAFVLFAVTVSCAQPDPAAGKRLYYAALISEIHTFSPFKITLDDFERIGPDSMEPSPFGAIARRVALQRGPVCRLTVPSGALHLELENTPVH